MGNHGEPDHGKSGKCPGHQDRSDLSAGVTHRILRCRQIPKFSCRTTAETAAVAIFPPPQAFLPHFARFVPILCAVKQI